MPSLFTTRNLHSTAHGIPVVIQVGIIIGVIISKLVIVPGPA